MLTGNKGEWSEIYTLFKLLSERKVTAGDSQLQKIASLVYPIVKIIRDESGHIYEFYYEGDIVIVSSNKGEFRIPIATFAEKAEELLNELRNTSSTAFPLPATENFMSSYGSASLKAKSSSKSDIRIEVYDHRIGTSLSLGFSIKSQIGGASTLFNASQSSNFIFRIDGANIADDTIQKINQIDTKSKIKDRIEAIGRLHGTLTFIGLEGSVFNDKLTLIDSAMPEILAEMLLIFFTSSLSKTKDILEAVEKNNPIGFHQDNGHPFYSYKIKRLFNDMALGMISSTVWTGQFDATGGFLVVTKDGDALCYHIYDRNNFEDYLLNNTKFETPSSSRHDFGHIYRQGDSLLFKLNLQIRFL